jgi:predicted TIM-barrel fold metal-dependent hydrolase
MTKIDLAECHLIDVHCHPFKESTKVLSEDEFTFIADYLAGFSNPGFLIPPDVVQRYEKTSGLERQELDKKHQISSTYASLRHHAQNLVLHKRMMRELATFLNCAPDPKDIVQTRNRRAEDYPAYIKAIFDDAKIDGLNVDDGYSELAVRLALPTIDLDEFRRYVPAKVWRTTRIEPLFQKALDSSSTFAEMESKFISSLEHAVKKLNAISFKSINAYRSGLEIKKTEPEEAKKDFEKHKSTKTAGIMKGERALKHLRNYMIWNALKKSVDLNVPFLFHTGVGDQDIVLDKCNPSCLWNMLVDEELRHARVVLVHVGYPFISEAAFLTTVLPNVYLDLSVLIPLGQVNPSRIAQVLEMAPLTKVMYASDVHLPDMYWLSAKIGKSMLGQALSHIVDADVLTEDEAYRAGQCILSENAREFYRL